MRVLGIETSCDETGVALYDSRRGLIADLLYSQASAHAEFGGVVPELASRDHQRKLLPLIRKLLADSDTEAAAIDGVAYTAGPGLVGALMVGACTGRALAMAWGVPAVAVHHMEGHLLAPLLEPDPPPFPFVALLVSGGHTQLVRVDGMGQYRLLGESLDDAAGEAFDKTAKLLGLPYPGGPELARLADSGDAVAYDFPRPMTRRPGLDFSFSGLKTHVLTTVEALRARDGELSPQQMADVAASFQEAVVDSLLIKCRRALVQEELERLVIAGGVSANRRLREVFDRDMDKRGWRAWYPGPAYCTDNGAMIAFAGCQRLVAGASESLSVDVRARWPLEQLPAVESRGG